VGFYERSIAMSREIGEPFLEIMGLENLGATYGWLGQLDKATPPLTTALKLAREIGEEVGQATIPENMGWVALLAGDDRNARERFSDSLARYRALGMKPPSLLVCLAVLKARAGDRVGGLEWLGLSRAAATASHNLKQILRLVDQFLPELSEGLEPGAVEAALERGGKLDLDAVFEAVYEDWKA